MMKHPRSKQLTSLKRKFNQEESHALRYRKQGDLMNYLRKLKAAKKLRTEFHLLIDLQKNAEKPQRILEEELVEV